MATRIRTRAFLVGCPRSGTTLLQSMLFAHPDIYSFPETNFFLSLLGARDLAILGEKPQGTIGKLREFARRAMALLGIVDKRRRTRAWEPIPLLPNFDAAAPCKSLSVRYNIETLVQVVDAASLKAGRPIWIEKSPDHLFYVKRIQQYIPGAIFIHIIRNGRDTVASLIDAARKYPDVWKAPASPEFAIRRWKVALRESLQYRGDPRHCLVCYEELVSDPVKVLSGLCGFLGCDFDMKMVEDYSEKVVSIVRDPTNPLVSGPLGPILNTADTKFRELFSPAEQDFILKGLSDSKY
jgi:hypothetical protein